MPRSGDPGRDPTWEETNNQTRNRRGRSRRSQIVKPELICYMGQLPVVENDNYDSENENSIEFIPFDDNRTTLAKENNSGQYTIDNFVAIMNKFREDQPTLYPLPYSYLTLTESEKNELDEDAKYDTDQFKYTENDIQSFQEKDVLSKFNISGIPSLKRGADALQKQNRRNQEKRCENQIKGVIDYITGLFRKSESDIKDEITISLLSLSKYLPDISGSAIRTNINKLRDKLFNETKKILKNTSTTNQVAYLRTTRFYYFVKLIQCLNYLERTQQLISIPIQITPPFPLGSSQPTPSQPTPSQPRPSLVRTSGRDNLLSPFDFNRNTGNLGLLFKVEISNDSINEPIPIKIFGKDYCKLTSSTILPNSFPHTLYLEPPKTSKPITIAFYQLFRNINSLQSYPNLYQTQPEDSTSDYSITDLMIPVLEIKTNTLVSSSSEPLLQNSSELTQHIILNKRSELRSREPSDSDFEIDPEQFTELLEKLSRGLFKIIHYNDDGTPLTDIEDDEGDFIVDNHLFLFNYIYILPFSVQDYDFVYNPNELPTDRIGAKILSDPSPSLNYTVSSEPLNSLNFRYYFNERRTSVSTGGSNKKRTIKYNKRSGGKINISKNKKSSVKPKKNKNKNKRSGKVMKKK